MFKRKHGHLSRYCIGALISGTLLLALWGITVFCIYQYVGAGHAIFETPEDLPGNEYTALLLGCTPSGTSFQNRVASVITLYHAGKICKIIASGSRDGMYDEPSAMRKKLIAEGVPEEIIVLDFGGLRTLDSVIRAHTYFHAKDLLIVSQRYHVERAMFQAQENHISATGFAAADSPFPSERKWLIFREIFARAYAVLDTKILHTQPKYPGEVPSPEPLVAQRKQKSKN